MKTRFFLLLFTVAVITNLNAQDVNRKLGLGVQASYPFFGLSLKYGITQSSVVQATVAPFSTGLLNTNFYGARYVHRFPGKDDSKVIIDPYLFAGGGLVVFKLSEIFGESEPESFFGYSLGGGLEFIVAKKIGLSAEAGYGKLRVVEGIGFGTITGGVGIHYYIK